MTAQEPEDGLDAAILDGILKALPAAMAAAYGPPVDAPWTQVGIMAGPPVLIPVDPPALELIDVNWPDGTVKVFPDRTGYTVHAKTLAVEPAAADLWGRIMEEVHRHRLEETILADLADIITERGMDAPGLLIIQTPDGQWAIKESEWLAPGSAMLSRLDVPDLMAVAQGDGWLYYRQTRPSPDPE